MKRSVAWFVGITLLFVSALRLPAPIHEESTPAPRPPTVKREANEKSDNGFSQKFEGTWRASSKSTNAKGVGIQMTSTLVVKGRRAGVWTVDTTRTLPPGGTPWSDLPTPYNSSPTVYDEEVFNSTDLKVNGSELRIYWQSGRITDWSPKTIPYGVLQNAMGKRLAPWSVTCAVSGNRLSCSEEGSGKTTPFDRVK